MPGIWMRLQELIRGTRLDGDLDEEVELGIGDRLRNPQFLRTRQLGVS
jgi:hypothetical protein